MIQQFTDSLPRELALQLRSEYDTRLKDVKYLVSGKFDYYAGMQQHINTLESLLAMSIFYKRVVTNLDAATKFSGRVLKTPGCKGVLIGDYLLDREQHSLILTLILRFREIMQAHHIPQSLFEYLETKEFLRKAVQLMNQPDDNEQPV